MSYTDVTQSAPTDEALVAKKLAGDSGRDLSGMRCALYTRCYRLRPSSPSMRQHVRK